MSSAQFRVSDEQPYSKVIVAMMDETAGHIFYVAGRARRINISADVEMDHITWAPGFPTYAIPTSPPRGWMNIEFVQYGLQTEQPDFSDIKTPEEIEAQQKQLPPTTQGVLEA